MTPDFLILLAWAAHLSGYPIPAEIPRVVIGPIPAPQGVAGTYANGVVQLRAADECFAIHELTHFLLPADMPRCEQERIAYRVQIQWATENGVMGCRPRTGEHEPCLEDK